MTTIQEWQGPGKRPATYQERLARIREEIKKAEAWKEREPSFETPDIVLRGLRKRESELLVEIDMIQGQLAQAEIENDAAPNCSFCHGHGVVPVWVNGMVTDGDCPNKPYCKGGKIEKEAAA